MPSNKPIETPPMSVYDPDRAHLGLTNLCRHLDKLSRHSSPLLELPAEIRNRIYDFVLGGQLIHIRRRDQDWSRSNSFSCNAHVSEEEACRDFQTKEDSRTFRKRHEQCSLADRFNLSMLRCCRQVYEEARLLHFTHNIFSFADQESFVHFVNKLFRDQRTALNSLQFVIPLAMNMFDHFFGVNIQRLTGVRTLYLLMELGYDGLGTGFYRIAKEEVNCDMWELFTRYARHLPLRHVYVEVNGGDDDDGDGFEYENGERWTLTDKRSCAAKITRQLLGKRPHTER